MDDRRRSSSQMEISLFWRVCLVNAAVFATGIAVLAASPATVSFPILRSELFVLLVGLALIVVANAALVRAVMAPLSGEGAGIRGMRERALLLGARLDVSAADSGGTGVRLLVPAHVQAGPP